MFRLAKLASGWCGSEIRDIEDDIDNIETFIEAGNLVLLCADIETATAALGIDKDDIQIVFPADIE